MWIKRTNNRIATRKIKKEIENLAQQRQAYIDEELKKGGESAEDDLGKLINQSVLDYALARGYKTE